MIAPLEAGGQGEGKAGGCEGKERKGYEEGGRDTVKGVPPLVSGERGVRREDRTERRTWEVNEGQIREGAQATMN